MTDERADRFERYYSLVTFEIGPEAMEAKAEVLMADAIEVMDDLADGLTERDPETGDYLEPPIPMAERREVIVRMCGETFDRLMRERKAYADKRRAR